jgi:hypothetical protein
MNNCTGAVHHHDDEMGWIRIDNNKMTWCCYMTWKIGYQEEILEIFKRHRVAFDERYVWD